MRFGGHETFPVRDGWLQKGLALLETHPARLAGEDAPDWLGVGQNMAKSIRHWLAATGLARVAGGSRTPRSQELEISELGSLVSARDPYLTAPGTWWGLHVNLVLAPDYAATWSWFFNYFHLERFDRAVCFDALRRHLEMSGRRMPSITTLQRDLACLLASYSRVIPPRHDDPEENIESPLSELGILRHFRQSGRYQQEFGKKEVPAEVVGFVLSKAHDSSTRADKTSAMTIQAAATVPGSPGRVLGLSPESLFEILSEIEDTRPELGIRIGGLAGERTVVFPRVPPATWLKRYYDHLEEDERDVA